VRPSDGHVYAAEGANYRLLLRMSKSPLLVPTSPCVKIDPRSTGNQNGKRETGSKCDILMESTNMWVGEQHGGTNVRVSEQSEIAACIRT